MDMHVRHKKYRNLEKMNGEIGMSKNVHEFLNGLHMQNKETFLVKKCLERGLETCLKKQIDEEKKKREEEALESEINYMKEVDNKIESTQWDSLFWMGLVFFMGTFSIFMRGPLLFRFLMGVYGGVRFLDVLSYWRCQRSILRQVDNFIHFHLEQKPEKISEKFFQTKYWGCKKFDKMFFLISIVWILSVINEII